MPNEHYNSLDDHQLFTAISTGDEAAFRQLFEKYTPQLEPYITGIVRSSEIAKEIVQDTFLKIWIKRETLPEVEKPSAWIYRIATNLALTHFRRHKMEQQIIEGLHRSPAANTDIVEEFSVKELEGLIHTAINTLPPKRQQIFKLSREMGLTRKEIAAQLNISENTIRNQIAISIKHIQDHISSSSGFYVPAVLLLAILSHC